MVRIWLVSRNSLEMPLLHSWRHHSCIWWKCMCQVSILWCQVNYAVPWQTSGGYENYLFSTLPTIWLSCLLPESTVLATGKAATLSVPSSTTEDKGLPQVPNWLIPITSEDSWLSLSISLLPVPAWVVQQIRLGRYMVMWDQLWKNSGQTSLWKSSRGTGD